MAGLDGKLVLLCVSGSIAAYKAAELTRQLTKSGATVRVAMTRSAQEFIGAMTFEALTGAPVHLDVFAHADGPVDRYSPANSDAGEGSIQHINLSKSPDLIVVAPATADLLGRVAAGLGDDVVTTSILAADAPVVFAPAMNQRMWANPIVQQNVDRLQAVGYGFIQPTEGSLACGEVGMGRMAEPADIVVALPAYLKSGRRGRAVAASAVVTAAPVSAPAAARPSAALSPTVDLSGKRVLVTLGRTEEDIDPVRYLSNRSSGKMGLAIARAAVAAGADVKVVAGVTSIPIPDDLSTVRVRTAAEMKDAVHDHFPKCDVLIMVAAVADYRAATEKPHKMESGEKRPSIELEPTDDILLSLKPLRKHQVMVGFALETRAEERRARDKLKRKGLDLIVANNPLKEGAGFGTDTNLVSFIRATGAPKTFPVLDKNEIARNLVEEVSRLFKKPAPSPRQPRTDASSDAGTAAPATSAGRTRSRSGRGRGRVPSATTSVEEPSAPAPEKRAPRKRAPRKPAAKKPS